MSRRAVWLGILIYAYGVFVLRSRWASTAGRWAAGLVMAFAVFMLMMLPLMHAWRPTQGYAGQVYACGMVFATLAASSVASMIFPIGQRLPGMLACIGLTMAYPAIVAGVSDPTAPVKALAYLYIAAVAGGGGIALMTAMMSQADQRLADRRVLVRNS
jgi:hypothetical protein